MREQKLTITQKQQIVDAILQSDTFKNAPTSIALLKYLFEATYNNTPLKEGVIEMEFFRGDPDGKSNSRVRVNVYNLRKKLTNYYSTEGADDDWELMIEKGQYGVKFRKNTSQPSKNVSLINLFRWDSKFIPYIGLLLIALLSYLWNAPESVSPLWQKIIQSKQPTHLYIGDAFGYRGKTISGNEGWTRDFNINNVEDYLGLIEDKPELKEKTRMTDLYYSTRMAEHATYDLGRYFQKWNEELLIKYATNTSFTNIKNGNLIYVGRFYNQSDFVYLFNQYNPYFKIKDKHLIYTNKETGIENSYETNSQDLINDFTIVSKIKTSQGRTQFFFFSNHDIGVMASVEFFTNTDSLKTFDKRYAIGEQNFTAVFIAEGKERINLSLKEELVVTF
ncbi:hypothetical protein [Flammeovirga sp. SJP92]|uniref:hypothetical protein n=1 Tax=Flammeovirga sp. SJP92 TaxID=1775430 RepID=UPI00078683D6|nr:hypothetical protein [Flammeovirga sp. SJP92]KXX68445.1 hypothetical protein AVL50_22005 [Flammeovirga sp. SJP92]